MPKKVQAGKKVSKAAAKIKKITKTKQSKKEIKKNVKKSKIEKAKVKVQKPKNNTKKNAKGKSQEILELGLLLDCSGSMSSWIERAKKTLQEIVDNIVKSSGGNLKVRVAFIGYRDHYN